MPDCKLKMRSRWGYIMLSKQGIGQVMFHLCIKVPIIYSIIALHVSVNVHCKHNIQSIYGHRGLGPGSVKSSLDWIEITPVLLPGLFSSSVLTSNGMHLILLECHGQSWCYYWWDGGASCKRSSDDLSRWSRVNCFQSTLMQLKNEYLQVLVWEESDMKVVSTDWASGG